VSSGGSLAVAGPVLAYGLLSGRLERSAVTAPLAFPAAGWLLGHLPMRMGGGS
jgi:hypothetical protein